MDICNGHNEGEVCYEGRECPACAIEQRMQKEIDTLTEKINNLESHIDDLEVSE